MKSLQNIPAFLFIAILLFSCSAGKNNVASIASPGSAPITIRVMSYNIHHANPPSKPGLIDIQAIANVIKAQSPDLVALQEVDVNTNRSGSGLNQATEIAKLTGMKVVFGKAINYDGGEYGVAILSKYDFSQTNNLPLPTAEGTNGERRTLLSATIHLPGKRKIVFASTHLDAQRNDTNRILQITKVNEYFSEEKLPVILAGDLNARPDSRVINKLDNLFTRSCFTNCPNTSPSVNARSVIDYISYISPMISTLDHRVINEEYASDHLPVVADLQIK